MDQDTSFEPVARAAATPRQSMEAQRIKREVSAESLVFLGAFLLFFCFLGARMGLVNLMNTLMGTAYDILLHTVLYIMAIAVIAGAISALLVEFGVVALINKLISPLMMPLYNMPGASVIGIITTYLSDNPAILTLAEDPGFRRYFRKYQLPALTNLGTAYGMGMIITAFVIGLRSPSGESFAIPALIGNLGAIVGSIVSVRIMHLFTKRVYGRYEPCEVNGNADAVPAGFRSIRAGGIGTRFMEALLDGGKSGVNMGLAIIPGTIVICSVIMLLSNGPSASGEYTGAAFEGVALLPGLGEKLDFLLNPLFGFQSSQAISVPITALGAAGAAIGLIPHLISQGLVSGNDMAVFTAMCMCWSGYLSTHIAMMDRLGCSRLTGKAILSHTIGGLCAGVAAHWMYVLFTTIP